ncbi:hypothetical protein BGZ54_003589, partial [Gamsiella multidivaricata]
SFGTILQKSSSSTAATSVSSSPSSTTTRTKFPFSSTTTFKNLSPQDLAPLSSQEIVRLTIYVMKRTRLGFADPLTSERVHTEGEKQPSTSTPPRSGNDGRGGGEGEGGGSTAAQVYLTKDFHIGNSVLHNRRHPTTPATHSLLALATFCARASGSRAKVSSTPNSEAAMASMVGAKWLAKLGEVMFGGPCAHAGHAHHRRTRASLDLVERQSAELGRSISPHDDDAPSSNFAPAPASSSPSPSKRQSTGSASPVTPRTGSRTDKWCRHCSRAMACLVIASLEESPAGAKPEEVAAFEDSGFGMASAGPRSVNVPGPDSPPSSSSSSLTTNRNSTIGNSEQHDGNDPHPRLKHKEGKANHDPQAWKRSSSPSTAFDRSHEHDDDAYAAPSMQTRSPRALPVSPPIPLPTLLSSSPPSMPSSEFPETLDSALGSNSTEPSTPKRTDGASSSQKKFNLHQTLSRSNSQHQRQEEKALNESDLELVILPKSASASAATSIPTSPGSSSARSDISPHPDTATTPGPAFATAPADKDERAVESKTEPESDLAEALTASSAVSIPSSGLSLKLSVPAASLGIHPSLESVHDAVASHSRRTSATPSRESKDEIGMEGENEENPDSLAGDKPIQRSLSQSRESSIVASSVVSSTSVPASPRVPSPSSTSLSSVKNDNEKDGHETETETETGTVAGADGSGGDVSETHHHRSCKHASTDTYAREVEESMRRTPPLDPGRPRTPLSSSSAAAAAAIETELREAKTPDGLLTLHNDEVNDSGSNDDALEDGSSGNEQDSPKTLDRGTAAEEPAELQETTFSLTDDKDTDLRPRSPSSTSTIPAKSNVQHNISNTSISTRDDSDGHHYHPSMAQVDQDLENEHDQEDNDEDDDDSDDDERYSDASSSPFTSSTNLLFDSATASDSSCLTSPISPTTLTSDPKPLDEHQQRKLEKRLRRRRQRLVDDAKRKQEQLDKITAQLEHRTLGKIREQVSFWEAKGVLEQKVVPVVEVGEDDDDNNGK